MANGTHLVRWLSRQSTSLPDGDDWLSEREQALLATLRFEKRRRDWRLGRWTAKELLRRSPDVADCPAAELEIIAAADGAPEVWRQGERLDQGISITHRENRAVAALTPEGRVGCDLEVIEPRSVAFVRDYFTAAELAAAETSPVGERAIRIALIWSAKESVLKVLREGLRMDTRDVEVDAAVPLGDGATGCLRVSLPRNERAFECWYGIRGKWVLTLCADPAPADPPYPIDPAGLIPFAPR